MDTTEVRVCDGRDGGALPGAAAAEEPLGRGPCSLDRGLRQDPEPGLNGQLLESWPRIVLSS